MHGASRRAAVYCRLSFAPDGSVEKVERQEADGRHLAAERSWDVAEVHVDNNVSAWRRDRRRPGWDALLESIRDRRVDAVIVYHLDRLMRQPHDLEALLSLADRQGITLASPHGSRDLDSPDDRFVLRIEVAQACREVDNISRRSKRGWAARAEQGAPRRNGIRAYGWKRDGRTIDRHEAAVIRRIARQILDGQSLNAVVNDLNRRGEPTSAGKRWTISTVRGLMTNPRLIGKRVHLGHVVADGQWPPILPPDTFRAVQLALTAIREANPQAHRPRTRRYLLSGLARCAECGGPLYVQQPAAHRNASPAYACRACRKVSRAQPQVDDYVTRVVVAYLEGWTFPPRSATVTDLPAIEEAAALRDRIEATMAEFADDDLLTPADLRKTVAPLKARLAEIDRETAALAVRRPAQAMAGDGAAQRWAAADLRLRREVLADAVTVRISPAGGRRVFDGQTIHVKPQPWLRG